MIGPRLYLKGEECQQALDREGGEGVHLDTEADGGGDQADAVLCRGAAKH